MKKFKGAGKWGDAISSIAHNFICGKDINDIETYINRVYTKVFISMILSSLVFPVWKLADLSCPCFFHGMGTYLVPKEGVVKIWFIGHLIAKED